MVVKKKKKKKPIFCGSTGVLVPVISKSEKPSPHLTAQVKKETWGALRKGGGLAVRMLALKDSLTSTLGACFSTQETEHFH